MLQAVTWILLLHVRDSRILYQHKDVLQIKRKTQWRLWKPLSMIVDNKLSIHFGEDKTKSILFASIRRAKNICQLNVKYMDINIKQN